MEWERVPYSPPPSAQAAQSYSWIRTGAGLA